MFLESPFLLCPLKEGLLLKHLKTLRGKRRNGRSKTPFCTTVSPQDAFSAPLAHPQISLKSAEKVKLKPKTETMVLVLALGSVKGIFALSKENQERKISPKSKFLGRTSRGHPGVIRADIPAQNFGQGGPNPGKTSILARTSMTRRRGRPRPQGISKNFGQKNFGLNFRSLEKGLDWHTCA